MVRVSSGAWTVRAEAGGIGLCFAATLRANGKSAQPRPALSRVFPFRPPLFSSARRLVLAKQSARVRPALRDLPVRMEKCRIRQGWQGVSGFSTGIPSQWAAGASPARLGSAPLPPAIGLCVPWDSEPGHSGCAGDANCLLRVRSKAVGFQASVVS